MWIRSWKRCGGLVGIAHNDQASVSQDEQTVSDDEQHISTDQSHGLVSAVDAGQHG